MENEKKINWLSLFIKIIIIFIFIIIVIWLISKIINRNKLSENFINNINNIQKVSVEYFKKVELPLDKGKSIKITLGELIEKDLSHIERKYLKNNCDLDNSYSKITREEDDYTVETMLKCGKEKDTITNKFDLKDCKNCNGGQNDNSVEENNNNSESSEEHQLTYYEHAKETTTYTKWMKGNKTGDNIENKYEYYGIDSKEYYSLGIVNKKDIKENTVTYTLKLNSVPNSKYYFTTIEESSYFNTNEKEAYLSEKNITMEDREKADIKEIEKHSLKGENFTYKLSPYYRKGSFYVDVTVFIKNIDKIESYYDKETKEEIYLIPINFVVKFTSNEILETKPSGEYETISYYRYIEKNRDVIWSTETYVEGYIKTGQTKVK